MQDDIDQLNQSLEDQENRDLNESIRNAEEDHGFDQPLKKTYTYTPEPASEKQFKYWVYLCRGLKGMTAPEMGRLEEKFMKKYDLGRWSDMNKDQMVTSIDFVNKYWNKEGKYNDLVKLLIEK